jgi:hypothetical protein
MKRRSHVLALEHVGRSITNQSSDYPHSITPLWATLIGFLVYLGLFASYLRYSTVLSVWKLLVFTFVLWWVSEHAAAKRRQYLTRGAVTVLVGSLLAALIESHWLPKVSEGGVIARLLVEGTEAFGEALITAGLTAFIRNETISRDGMYFRETTALRLGQTVGIVVAAQCFEWLWRKHSLSSLVGLVVLRVLVLLMILRFVCKRSVADPSNNETDSGTENLNAITTRLRRDLLVGTASYALFFLTAFGAPAVLQDGREKILLVNGAFAIVSMCVIFFASYTARGRTATKQTLLTFQTITGTSTLIVTLFWTVALWLAVLAPKHEATMWLELAVGALGFCTTSTYVIGELSSGLHGKQSQRSRQIASYLARARLGPIVALMLIFVISQSLSSQGLQANRVRPALAITLAIVVIACGALVCWGVWSKWQQEQLGGAHD